MPLTAEARARLAEMSQTSGHLVYIGQVSPEDQVNARFRYERRVKTEPGALQRSTHITFASQGDEAILAQSAVSSSTYELLEYEEIHAQTGVVSSVRVLSGGELRFVVHRNGKAEESTENISEPAVVGPTLFGFVLAHWDGLLAGEELPVRFVVAGEAQTYGFRLRLSNSTPETTAIEMRASSFLVRMAIAPMFIVFDTTTRAPLRYAGRVPPLLEGSEFNARVEYELSDEAYR